MLIATTARTRGLFARGRGPPIRFWGPLVYLERLLARGVGSYSAEKIAPVNIAPENIAPVNIAPVNIVRPRL